jgi:prepilin-type N-terminal cleavage/methylation domain-containing protein
MSRRGFTITEVLVALLIGLLVMIGLHQMLVAGVSTETTTSSQMEADRKAQVAMDDITSRLRHASPSTLSATSAVLSDHDSAHPDRIDFAGPPGADLEPPKDAGDDIIHNRYWLEAGTLKRKIGGNNYTGGDVLADNVTQLVFSFYARDSITKQLVPTSLAHQTVAVQVQLTIQEGRISTSMQSTVGLRNM